MTDSLTRTLRQVRRGPVARRLLADIRGLAEREGIHALAQRLSPVTLEDLCEALQTELGYALTAGNRRRMVGLLLDLFAECGWAKASGGRWEWCAGRAMPLDPSGPDGGAATGDPPGEDDQYPFFETCLASVPAYLRGAAAAVQFDGRSAASWERFLGCEEFRTCRSVLLELMGVERRTARCVLDLCHGPGWGLEALVCRSPASRITAVDFTDAFCEMARARVDRAQARNRQRGQPAEPVVWVGPDRWRGFGHRLPFADGSFDAVLFACGDPYIPASLRKDTYREVARVLRPGGCLGVLTRCRPDAEARHVASFWLRIAALAHDFAESVCLGWEGFAGAEENARVFSEAGFLGGTGSSDTMSFLDASLWVLRKAAADG
jgi:SAM-dependent methyltransferase